VGIQPEWLVFDGANMWVSNNGSSSVTKIVAATGARVGTFPVGAYPAGLAFDGSTVWVANSQANTASRL
jgi:YVTN family beta-propeller protein